VIAHQRVGAEIDCEDFGQQLEPVENELLPMVEGFA
jgi:hypothetical protein